MLQRDRYIPNDDAKKNRKSLRTFPTQAEYVLWQELRKKQLGYRFRRQTSIGPFIVDFYCHELRCIIEADGPVHADQLQKDQQREIYLQQKGYSIIRFTNDEILFEREKVVEQIRLFCTGLK